MEEEWERMRGRLGGRVGGGQLGGCAGKSKGSQGGKGLFEARATDLKLLLRLMYVFMYMRTSAVSWALDLRSRV